MRYVEGPTLKELIDRGLTPEQAVALVRQVLEGARFAHRNGIVHRDLKPQNVIVDGEGKAVVTDFGIARAGVSEITQTGSVMGTPQYLSPEQAQGFEVTPVSDLYSIGVILYEALTRPRPLRGRKRRRDRDETGRRDAAAAELDQPAGLAGARRGGDAGAGEGAGPALPERRRLHRRPRRGAERPGREPAARPPSRRCRRSSPCRRRSRRSAGATGGSGRCWSPRS